MLIVLEGMDNTGKTTLANTLIKEFPNLKYTKPVPSEGPEGMNGDYMMNGMRELFQKVRDGEDFITDRINLISELIYGPVCRGASRLSQEQYAEILPDFLELKPLIFFCKPRKETILKGIRDQFQMDGVAEKAPMLCEVYEAFFDSWWSAGIGFYVYSYEVDPNARGPQAYIRSSKVINNE